MSINAKDVEEIMKLLEASAFDELKLEQGDLKLHLRRTGAPVRAEAPAVPAAPIAAAPPPSAPKTAPMPATGADPSWKEVTSPLLGTFYRAPKPGEPPFVSEGDRVEPDTIIGIVEVMKLMNTVRAGVSGTIAEIVAVNATLVEHGEVLMRVKAA